ncbi:hypothetical protein KSS87_010978 [Heliosperma pusillum]|nr:hypothetical protein KSS87_010978 [Heliosperma pusillum]
MASPAYDGTNGGVGGKFRRKPFRKTHTTPYDRPPTAIRQTQSIVNNNNNNGWFAKIVDPASRMITAGARKFFSSVFQKRLLAPPSSPPQIPPSPVMDVDEGNTIEHLQLKTATNVVTSDAKVPVDCGGLGASMPALDSNGVAELEDILKHKTFSRQVKFDIIQAIHVTEPENDWCISTDHILCRSQIDHLTALLLSRTTENSNGAEKERSDPKLSDLQAIHARRDIPLNLHGPGNQIVYGQSADFSTPEVRSKMLPDDVASPAEIAKMYMGSRSTKASPSVLRLQTQLPKEDFSPRSNPLSKSLLPVTSLTQKSVIDIGTSSKGLTTPRFRGRSAIYSMARTPYSRGQPVTNFKAAETNFGTGGGSSYLEHTENNPSKKQVLKRRSSVLEHDIGSVGPIRRIRQKPNLLHPKTLSLPPPGGRQLTHVSGVLSDVAEVPSSKERTYENRSFIKVLGENSLPGSSSGYVPSQSVEMAQKIFEQLDKFSPRKNADFSVGKSPMKTPDTEGPDSLKPLQSSQDIKKFTSLNSAHARNHQLQTSSVLEEINAKNLLTTSASRAPQASREGKKVDSYLPSTSKVAEPQKQRSFQMSAPEDFLDMDDDSPSNEVALSTPVVEGKQHAESSAKSIAVPDILQQDQTVALDKLSAMKTAAQLRKNDQESLVNGSLASETTASFPSSVVSLSSPPSNLVVADATGAPQPILKFDGVAQHNEKSDILKSSSTKSDNLPSNVWFSQPAAKDTKVETPARVEPEVNGPDKTDNKSSPVFGNSFTKFGDASSFGALSNGSKLNDSIPVNGGYSTLPSKSGTSGPDPLISSSSSPSPVLPSLPSPSPSATLMFSNGGVQSAFTSSTSSPLTSSTSDKSGTVTAPVFPFASGFSSSSMTSSASASDTADKSGAKSNATDLSNTTGNVFDAKPSAGGFASTTLGSIAGGDGQTAGSTTASSKLTCPFQTGTNASSLFPSSSVSVPTSTAAPGFPGQSATSVSVPASTSALSFSGQSAMSPSTFVFNSSGSTGTSSGSIFGSFSASALSSGPGSTTSALGSSFTSSSLPISSSTTSIFGATSQSPKPASTIAPSPTSPVFSFGLGSSGAASSTPVFGASSSIPAFGASSSTPAFATTSSATPFGATTSASASNSLPFVFGGNSGVAASAPAMTHSLFQSQPAASTPAITNSPFQSLPAFGNPSSQPFTFGSTPAINGDQMTMEDTMAEDSSQPSTPPPGAFVAPISAPSGGFAFNAAPAAASPFQFNTQPTQITSPNPFQPSGSLEFNGGTNSFSLGTSDKSQRRIVRVKKGARRKSHTPQKTSPPFDDDDDTWWASIVNNEEATSFITTLHEGHETVSFEPRGVEEFEEVEVKEKTTSFEDHTHAECKVVEEVKVEEVEVGTLDDTWKAIMEAKSKGSGPHLKKSETWSSGDRGGGGGDRRLTYHDELKRRADEFIERVNREMRLQRMESHQRFLDIINRGL